MGPPAVHNQTGSCFHELFIEVVILLLTLPYECAKTGVAPPAQCTPLQCPLVCGNIPTHFRIGQSWWPLLAWLNRILLTTEELRRRLCKLLWIFFWQKTPCTVRAFAARSRVW